MIENHRGICVWNEPGKYNCSQRWLGRLLRREVSVCIGVMVASWKGFLGKVLGNSDLDGILEMSRDLCIQKSARYCVWKSEMF